MGIVKRVEHNGVLIDLGNNTEGFIEKDDLIPREAIRNGDRVRAFLKEVRAETKGPQLFLSRTHPDFLINLFSLEVPEVGQDLIEILSAARDPGVRAKIAVKSNDPRLDPVGACVGMRGSRVQSVSNEIAGERIDIILWDENPAQFVINAMSPAAVLSIVMDEESKSMDIAVEEEKLSQAIGRGGQNVKLASQLTGWDLNVMTEGQADEKSEAETLEISENFEKYLGIKSETALILAQEGFSSIDEIAYAPPKDMTEIEVFDENDKLIGLFKQKLFPNLYPKFEMFDEKENLVSMLKGNLIGWNFEFLKDENTIARVTKKWSGIGKEMFTSADNYMLEIKDTVEKADPSRLLIFAAVICIDMVFKE